MTVPTDFDREAFLARLWALDAALSAQGFPPISPWWRQEIARFVRSRSRRWVIRAGRRAGKSTTLCRLAAAWAWFGAWSVPPGDVAVIPFISVSKDESASRLRTIAAVLKTLGLPYEQRSDEIELTGERRVLFKTFACTTSSVVGFTSIAVFGDEVARWESRESMSNPAAEVVGSLMPTLATQPRGYAVLCSSPWSNDDYHAQLFELGNTGNQTASFAATWTANPTVTEAATHDFESDPQIWAREYAAEPGATVSAALDREDIAACFGRPVPTDLSGGWLAIDASSLRGDAFTFLAGRVSPHGEIVALECGGFEGEAMRQTSMQHIVETIATRARAIGASVIYGDQREEAALRSMFAAERVTLTTYAWSEPSKDEAMQVLRRMMRERRLYLPNHEGLRRELTEMKARLMPSGRVRYETNGRDYASALVTLMHAIAAQDLRLSGSGLGAELTRINALLTNSSSRQPGRFSGMPGRGFG